MHDVPALDDEVAAYVAGWLYAAYEIDAREAPAPNATGTKATVEIPSASSWTHASARTVAAKIKDKPGTDIPDDSDLASLRAAILTSPPNKDLWELHEQDPHANNGHPGIRVSEASIVQGGKSLSTATSVE